MTAVKLHRIHALGQATRVQFDSIGLTWRGESSGVSLDEKTRIAHRLALCWNISEGVPTDELERGFWRDLADAVARGDLAAAQAVLAKMDAGTDTTSGRLHDCAGCLKTAPSDEDEPDQEAAPAALPSSTDRQAAARKASKTRRRNQARPNSSGYASLTRFRILV